MKRNMKKSITIILALGFAFIYAGCAQVLNKPMETVLFEPQDKLVEETLVTPEPEDPAIASETPTPEPTIEPTPEQESEPESEIESEPTEDTEVVVETAPIISASDTMEYPYNQPYGDAIDASGRFSNEKLSWYFNRNKEHLPPTAQWNFDIRPLGGYYLGDIGSKVIYLTFDHGYENGYTESILDTLKEKNVPAAFFVTQTYIRDNAELVKRTVEEGHIVANHSVTHPSFPDLTEDKVAYEINETARYFQEITGHEMSKFFRPPAGEYSARTLAMTKDLGYKTIFWSFAYMDWLVDDQPGKEVAYNMVMDNLHNGAILLLHAVSQSNMEALPDIIDGVRAQGYEFKTLYNLP